MPRRIALLLGIASLLVSAPLRAEEGMWTFDHFPRDKVKKAYGFTIDDAWLNHVMRSSARLGGGCSASFVSQNGLVMTNHHCAHGCISQLSTRERDLVASGYYAKNEGSELRCPEMEVNQLINIKDVTAVVVEATRGLQGEAYQEARKTTQARLEKDCQTDAQTRCDLVNLYRGGQYRLHTYRRFDDVRLVFAPEMAIAFFGGDPDNFMFPRYDLDVTFLRVYDNGKPAATPDYFRFSKAAPKEGMLTFVSGNPGGTDRLLTLAQLEYQRDVSLPEALFALAELRGVLTEFGRRGLEERRISEHQLFGVENRYKAMLGRWQALVEGGIVAEKAASEKMLRAQVARNPRLRKSATGAWDAVEKATQRQRELRKAFAYLEGGTGGASELWRIARHLVRGTHELTLPDGKRLEEYRDAAIPTLRQRLFSQAPIYDSLQTLLLTHAFTKLREHLGPDHAFVKKLLGNQSPDELASWLVKGTGLKNLAFRRSLWEGGEVAIKRAANNDPLLALLLSLDADGRAIRKTWETEVDAVVQKNTELIAQARFAVQGDGQYPDATSSARLSYGSVKGYTEDGRQVAPVTDFAGAYARHTGKDPFALPESWLRNKATLDLGVPLNFATSNDIIGGNSGSPVLNQDAAVVGLIFDGNIQSLGGDYGFDPATNRAVSVSAAGLIQALDKIYHADRILKELGP
jgi:Peptidase S46